MTDHKDLSNVISSAKQLRQRAEQQLQASEALRGTPRTEVDTQRLLHELEVHQIELEMQNLELKQAWEELENKVKQRTRELHTTNQQLTLEIEQRHQRETALAKAYAEIRTLSDRLQLENIQLQREVMRGDAFTEIIGQSKAIVRVFHQVEQVAPQNATVLLLGETGTGKGLIARAIHCRSARKHRAMITVNCAALPVNLIESELFGREKGAFTGASARQMGRFELADGGTIFLDEIGEMPLELQVKLLRVIQDGEFERLGSPHSTKVDVRIIAASNRNLEQEIRAGHFREDLFYRLNVFPIMIPPLRQRSNDIPLLVHSFVDKYNKKIGRKITTISKETLDIFLNYSWPGNVRELESVIERAIITSSGTTLQVPAHFDTGRKPATELQIKKLADLECEHIVHVLQTTGWRVEGEKGAAILLGLNPSTLRARMRKYGIRRAD
jgi:transcriptional regulator with GAF, ATPase, and Fis domain